VLTLLWCFEMCSQKFEFILTNLDLAKVKTTCTNIINILWSISDNLSLADSWSCLWVIVEAVVIFLADSEQCSRSINLLTEVNIVNFINITFIHVTSEY